MTKLLYTPIMAWTDNLSFLEIEQHDMVTRLNKKLPTFECTGSIDNICRLYFDMDYHIEENESFNETINTLIKTTAIKYINQYINRIFNKTPIIATATSSYDKKYSWRFFISNLKMKKNEMKAFISKMNDFIEYNSSIYLQIEKRDGFFDTAIYNNNRKMRCVNTSKPDENRPLILVEGNIEDTLITSNLDNAELIEYEIPITPQTITKTTNETNTTQLQELLNMIRIDKKDRKTWMMVCSCILYNKLTNDDWLNFCRNNELNMDPEKENLFFNLQKKDLYPIEIYYLQSLAKKTDLIKYKEWLDKWNIKSDNTNNTIQICNNELEAINHVYDLLKNNIVFSNKILYYKHNNVWIYDEKIITAMLSNYVLNTNIYKTNEKNDMLDFVQNTRVANNVAKGVIHKAMTMNKDGWFQQNIHSSRKKILFDNGYYNFQTEKFYENNHPEFDTSIVFFEIIPYSYTSLTHVEIDMIDTLKQKLFYTPFGKVVGDYYILQLARGLAGDAMKRCLFGIGSSNTGKSIMVSALKSTCGGYFGSFNAINLAYNKSTNDEAQKLRWTMLLRTKRIIASSEIASNVEIDGNMIKKISNGGLDDLIARGHGGNETAFIVTFLPLIFANDLNKITPMDDALITRIRGIEYSKVAVDKPINELNAFEMKIDYTLKDTIETLEFKKAFMTILIQSYMEFTANEFNEIEPCEIKTITKTVVGNTYTLLEDFVMDFEITDNEDDFIRSSIIENWIKKKKISMTKFGLEMNKFATINELHNIKSKQKKINGKPIQCWIGIKEIIELPTATVIDAIAMEHK